jgi:hypothetical protein
MSKDPENEHTAFRHPMPLSDEKTSPNLRAVPLCPESRWPPPREKWEKIPPQRQLGRDIPNDPELIRWALAQAAKTVKRCSITPAPTCGITQEQREYSAHYFAVQAARAEREFIAELKAHARAHLSAFCELRQGGRL